MAAQERPPQQQAAAAVSLDEMPGAFLQLLIQRFLSPALKLRLRHCSRRLRQMVDSVGALRVFVSRSTPRRALELCAHVIEGLKLDVEDYSDVHHVLERLPAAAGQLPRLRAVTVRAHLLQPVLQALPSHQITRLDVHVVAHDAAPGPLALSSLLKLTVHQEGEASVLGTEWAAAILQSAAGQLRDLGELLGEPPPGTPPAVRSAWYELDGRSWARGVGRLAHLTRLALQCAVVHPRTLAEAAATAAAAPAGLRELDLSLLALDGHGGGLPWHDWLRPCRSNLTALRLTAEPGELDFAALAELTALQQLEYADWEADGSGRVHATSLAPLSACQRLTSLRLGGLLVPAQAARRAAALAGDSGAPPPLVQLTSLQRLCCTNAGDSSFHGPVSSLAPSLTYFGDTAWPPESTLLAIRGKASADSLAGLDLLRVLLLDIHSLVVHALYPSLTGLTSLVELHVEAVGHLSGEPGCEHVAGGVPCLPHLELLRIQADPKDAADWRWRQAYDSAEDAKLWSNQHTLRRIVLQHSVLLGGFMVHDGLLALLHERLPALEAVELRYCHDLEVGQLIRLAGSGAARRVVVCGCGGVSDIGCRRAQLEAGGGMVVEWQDSGGDGDAAG